MDFAEYNGQLKHLTTMIIIIAVYVGYSIKPLKNVGEAIEKIGGEINQFQV